MQRFVTRLFRDLEWLLRGACVHDGKEGKEKEGEKKKRSLERLGVRRCASALSTRTFTVVVASTMRPLA